MSLRLPDCNFFGPALPEPFVLYELEKLLAKFSPLLPERGPERGEWQERWETYRRRLRMLGETGGDVRVHNHVVEPLAPLLGYQTVARAEPVRTREGDEDGGFWLATKDGSAGLRAWSVPVGTDLDAPNRRGRAYRFSPLRVGARVLLAKSERAALLTDGTELRLLLCDPARPDSHVAIRLDRSSGWRASRELPDSFRVLLSLASPQGVRALPEIADAARLSQATVTRELRKQARRAVEGFVQGVLDDPRNAAWRGEQAGPAPLARTLWTEGLVLVYRLLFVLKMESTADPARAFSFAATPLWRDTFSPRTGLSKVVGWAREGADTGSFLEESLRALFRLFTDGIASSEMRVSPLGGALFGAGATPTLDALHWGESAVRDLLDALLWTRDNKGGREFVHYGALDVEDLGRVYEALLELEPGITTEPMCRLRRAKLEVVVPAAQGAPYRASPARAEGAEDEDEEAETEDEDAPKRGKGKTKVQWIEDIAPGRFFLRTGLGRKSSGSYYTPHPFVRFLVQETLGPQIAECSPAADPHPAKILALKVLDPAMGSGHFLVEACRFLGEALYEACRLCDDEASKAQDEAEAIGDPAKKAERLARAEDLRARVSALPDPDDELFAWLPSRAPEGTATGLSEKKALALCRRLVAVHCLYGVDKNRLAVELAKLSLWLESWAEGLPLTFLDHRLLCGDSLTGPFVEHLQSFPKGGGPVGDDLWGSKFVGRLQEGLAAALARVADLEASVGKDVADLLRKQRAKEELDRALAPFRTLAAAWSGGVMLGDEGDDSAYLRLVRAVAEGKDVEAVVAGDAKLREMVGVGKEGVPYDLVFPEVFHPGGVAERTGGFDAVVGNPPWDAIQPLAKEFYAAFDLRILDAPTRRERAEYESRVSKDAHVRELFARYVGGIEATKHLIERVYERVGRQAGGAPSGAVTDLWQGFAERGIRLVRLRGRVGWVLPSAFHANQSATGIRELYLTEAALRCCFSFENKRKLFDIHASFKFADVVAERNPAGTEAFDCAFYLHDLEWLFAERATLRYSRDFVERTGGTCRSLIELRGEVDGLVAGQLHQSRSDFGAATESLGVRLGRELHMTDDAHRFTPADRVTTDARLVPPPGAFPLHEGKTFHQYDDCWSDPPRYLVRRDDVADKPAWLAAAAHYRLAFRDIAASTNERTGIFVLLPPGVLCGNKAPCERAPRERTTATALRLLALANSMPFDWALRTKVQATVNLFILDGTPVPTLDASRSRFLSHAALRLTCNHAGYAPLWREQLGDLWHEPTPPFTWPVLAGDDARWAVRARIDAVVADAYGIDRAQYEHVLSSFSHKSYRRAPELCLAAFDELHATGLDAFIQRHDPYWDVPLNENLPEPVIDFGAVTAQPPVAVVAGSPAGPPRPAAPPGPEAPLPWMAISATDRSVQLLSLFMDRLRAQERLHTLNATRTEKFWHLAERHLGIDLEREPQKLVAGPIDKPRQMKAFHRAKMTRAFEAQEWMGQFRFVPGASFDRTVERARATFAPIRERLDQLLGIFVAADTDQAEILATLHAVWEDLLQRGQPVTDDALIAGFYAWHEDKAKHPRERLTKALEFMRHEELVPASRRAELEEVPR